MNKSTLYVSCFFAQFFCKRQSTRRSQMATTQRVAFCLFFLFCCCLGDETHALSDLLFTATKYDESSSRATLLIKAPNVSTVHVFSEVLGAIAFCSAEWKFCQFSHHTVIVVLSSNCHQLTHPSWFKATHLPFAHSTRCPSIPFSNSSSNFNFLTSRCVFPKTFTKNKTTTTTKQQQAYHHQPTKNLK